MRLSLAFLVDSVPFTKAVRDGQTSLGGSESACLGLARALKARGHDIHIYASKLSPDAAGIDADGVVWHSAETFAQMNTFVEWDVVVALRQCYFYGQKVNARLKLLWNQDLLVPQSAEMVMSVAWNIDKYVYVSEYHQAQWEDMRPEIAGHGWATKNGFDPKHVPADVVKNPNQIIHISRPERGLAPLLQMWPALKAQRPDAILKICRYESMYDGEGSSVKDMCLAYDEWVARVNAEVGGIEYLGSLNKAQLYQAIAESAVMWYPGVSTFAETSCIASIEAQACGTPMVGSYRGALPESMPSAVLVKGEHESPEYQRDSVNAVVALVDACKAQGFAYRKLVVQGQQHVKDYTYVAIAEEWEARIETWFEERYEAHADGILQQLIHEDDYLAARIVADGLNDVEVIEHAEQIIAGKAWTAEDYAATAIQDPEKEIALCDRFKAVQPHFAECLNVLDVACGNGSFAIGLALAYPAIHVHGVDYAAGNIERARACAEKLGVADRVTFERLTVFDFDAQAMHGEWVDWLADKVVTYDGLFVGEFIEHVAACDVLVDGLELAIEPTSPAVYTCPSGPFRDLAQRGTKHSEGHVHCFKHDDIRHVFGDKRDVRADFFGLGRSSRGADLGHWVVRYRVTPGCVAHERDLKTRILRSRPKQTLTVGIIAKDAENDLGRCLAMVWPIADEIIVGDTGSTDDTKAIALKYGAKVLDVTPVDQNPEGFAGARNQVLSAATSEWFCWIDADEMLVEGHLLRAYLEGPVFNGFVLHQNHVALDAPPSRDVPVRVFRNHIGIRFFGCVHEQPQWGDANTDIHPILEPSDVELIHTGYLTQTQRESKRVQRNRSLMMRDHKAFPDRLLSQVIYLREAVVQSDAERATYGMTERVKDGYLHAVHMFVTHFDDPAHKYHSIARPWYESALRALGLGWEMDITLAGKKGGMGKGVAQPDRVWVRDKDEFRRIVQHKLDALEVKMGSAPPAKTDPDIFAPKHEAVLA